MTTNRLGTPTARNTKAKSPMDPQECCDWANDRLHEDAREAGLMWKVTGDPKRPIALVG